MRKQEEFGLILCKTVQNQPRSWFYPKMNLRTVDTRSRNSVSSYAKLAVKLHFNCPKTACWLDTLPLACWWPLFRQRNSMFMKEFCCSQDVVAAMKSFWAHIHGLLTPMALTFHALPHKVLFFHWDWLVSSCELCMSIICPLAGRSKQYCKELTTMLLTLVFVSLLLFPLWLVNLADHISQNGPLNSKFCVNWNSISSFGPFLFRSDLRPVHFEPGP